MSDDTTSRHQLPLLHVGQSQKELTHNEALVKIDALLYPIVEAILATPPAGLTSSSNGLCWLIADAATGIWTNKDRQIARWSGGSWRYVAPAQGMAVWNVAAAKTLFYTNGAWNAPAAIANPTGGAVVDVEARTAITAILMHLRGISSLPA
jgi:hypothetical protein